MAIASLPWYDLPEIRWARDALWRAVARELGPRGWRDLARSLADSERYAAHWSRADLILSQCCGYDVLYGHAKGLQVVATPCYVAPGCEGSRYSSHIVVRADSPFRTVEDLRGARAAINSPTSHSGANALRHRVAPLAEGGRFFATVRRSGSHERSLRLIASREADVACIDCVTWALLGRHRPGALAGTRVLESTPRVPAPPFVTSARTTPERVESLRAALRAALEDPDLAGARDAQLLASLEELPASAYASIASMRRGADALCYDEIPAG